jgi:electron transfer flavoprotein alpha subunit
LGKARVLADALGAYVYLLMVQNAGDEVAQRAIHAGADVVVTAHGVPGVVELVDYFTPRAPQAILFPRSYRGRTLGPGVAQLMNGGLVGCAADLSVDPITQRVIAYQPILDDAARQAVTVLNSPAVVLMDTAALPAPFVEPWRNGRVQDAEIAWPEPPVRQALNMPAAPLALRDMPVVVAAGLELRDATGFALVERLAAALGGMVAGDLGALDAGWISPEQLVSITGQHVAPQLYLALGIAGDSAHLMAIEAAAMVVSVQSDPSAPIAEVADWNVFADPVAFAQALLYRLENANS